MLLTLSPGQEEVEEAELRGAGSGPPPGVDVKGSSRTFSKVLTNALRPAMIQTNTRNYNSNPKRNNTINGGNHFRSHSYQTIRRFEFHSNKEDAHKTLPSLE